MDAVTFEFMLGLALPLLVHRMAKVTGVTPPLRERATAAGWAAFAATLLSVVYLVVWAVSGTFRYQELEEPPPFWWAGILFFATLALVLGLIQPAQRLARRAGWDGGGTSETARLGDRLVLAMVVAVLVGLAIWTTLHLAFDSISVPRSVLYMA